MPTYVYKCSECGAENEEIQVKLDKRDDPRTCKECSNAMIRLVSPVEHRFGKGMKHL